MNAVQTQFPGASWAVLLARAGMRIMGRHDLGQSNEGYSQHFENLCCR
jgi:hypothetical protein